ncbi:hypothetical protein JL722_14316 [Aureococcus anophagefferens]|nr:hypothetical protein JL722_14316 [Aureococcus anophagefferens]
MDLNTAACPSKGPETLLAERAAAAALRGDLVDLAGDGAGAAAAARRRRRAAAELRRRARRLRAAAERLARREAGKCAHPCCGNAMIGPCRACKRSYCSRECEFAPFAHGERRCPGIIDVAKCQG